MSATNLRTKYGIKKFDYDKLLDGDDVHYGSFEEQLETAIVPGPRDGSNHCWIKRNKKTSTYYLYFALTEYFTNKGKFLLAARRFRTGTYIEYIISLDANDFSQGSKAYVGKIRSNFLRTNFTVYDSKPPQKGVKPSNGKASRRFAFKQISPQVPAGNFEVGRVTYKSDIWKSRRPREMISKLHCPPSSASDKPCDVTKMMENPNKDGSGFTILKNKAPKWHEDLKMWCLNFRGRADIASVKNFQLVATADQSQPSGKGDEETVLLQFGKVGNDIFTMDYKHPLSAFQAFAISLTTFGHKLACE